MVWGRLTGGTHGAPLIEGINCDKSVSQRCLWAILSLNDDPSDIGVRGQTPKCNEDSGVSDLMLQYTEECDDDSGVNDLTFEYSEDSRDSSGDNNLTLECMEDACSESGVSALTFEYTGEAGNNCGVACPAHKNFGWFSNSGFCVGVKASTFLLP